MGPVVHIKLCSLHLTTFDDYFCPLPNGKQHLCELLVEMLLSYSAGRGSTRAADKDG